MRHFIFLLSFIILVMLRAAAQEKTILLNHLTAEDGLSDNQVTCILSDPLGFIWVGTKDGLNRYDGREFYTFRYSLSDSGSVCGNNITCLALDNDSLLWIGTSSSGFCSYNFRTGKFNSYSQSNTPLFSNSINAITFDKSKNQLWLALNNYGLHLFDLKTKTITHDLDSLFSKRKRTFYDVAVKDSLVYLAEIKGQLSHLDLKKKKWPLQSGISHTVNKIFIDTDKNIWCGMWDNALHEFDDNTELRNSYIFDGTGKINLSGDEIISLADDNNKTLWCGTKVSGIHFFDIKIKSFVNKYKFSPPVTSRINCLYHDDLNRMWIGTESGLFIYDPLQNQFEITKLPVPKNISSCKVYDRVTTKDGKEYIVSACGLFYKTASQKVYSYKEFIYENEKLQLFSIFSDYKNRIFVGSNKTVFELDTSSIQLKIMKTNKNNLDVYFFSFSSTRINFITQVPVKKDTLIAISVYGHLISLIHPERQNIFYLYGGKKNKGVFFDNLTRKLFIDSKNNFWVCGASQGISKILIPDSLSFQHFNFNDTIFNIIYFNFKTWANKKSGKLNAINDVYDIVENNDGSYWLATQGWGLVKFYPDNDTIPFVAYDGNNKSLQGISKTSTEDLWIISSTGLLSYNTKTNRFKRYDKKNGITESIGGYFFQDKSKKLSVGYDGGFFSFDPNNILMDKEKPSAQITRMWVMDVASDSLLFSKINLTHENNFLKFYISANSFSNNEQTMFLYFLEGIDKDWHNNHNNPLITYTNLPHGNFTLKVKAINSDGVESNIMEMPIIITPPFYQTTWFYLTVMLALVGSAYTFYRYRIRQVLKLQEVRNKIARDLHDDIGSTLGSIHLYSQIATKKLNNEKPAEVKSILERIECSSGEIIDKTGDAVWAVKASNDTLKNLILRIESYAASLLGAAGIQFNIEFDERITGMKLEMTARKNIFLIYKEAIHNIIKYANCTMVTIAIKKNAGKLLISISDNGKGFIANETNPYNGNGIKNMKSRAEEINGIFEITSHEGKGTTIEIKI